MQFQPNISWNDKKLIKELITVLFLILKNN
jgi:hypothetical protein